MYLSRLIFITLYIYKLFTPTPASTSHFSCDDGQMWIVTEAENFGPFCDLPTGRTRRSHHAPLHHYDITNMLGHLLHGKETDIVIRNVHTQKQLDFGIRLSLGYDLLPGLPNGHGIKRHNGIYHGSSFQQAQCNYENVQASDAVFAQSHVTENAVNAWKALSAALAEVNEHFALKGQNCDSDYPAAIPCELINWGGSCERMVASIRSIVVHQCNDCKGTNICNELFKLYNALCDAVENPLTDTTSRQWGAWSALEETPDQATAADSHRLDNDPCSACPFNSICSVTTDGYACTCNEGFTMVNNTCMDKNQCANPEDHICVDNAECVDLPVGYRCDCKTDFEMKNGLCMDDDQCAVGPGEDAPCSFRINQICFDLPIGYRCDCKSGFSKVNGICQLESEVCENNVNSCPANSICIDTHAGYQCHCKTGFQMSDNVCVDTNQCEDEPCGDHSVCVDLPVGYRCGCVQGFKLINGVCQDEDQCEIPGICYINENCVNLPAAYRCDCKPGYFRVAGRCEMNSDENQCLDPSNYPCPENSRCVDEPTGYQCKCILGFYKVKGQCEPVCDEDQCLKANVCPVNSACTNNCIGFECNCNSGFHKNGTDDCVQTCDINQCDLNLDTCSDHAVCVNQCSGYICVCQVGYHREEEICVQNWDENQCLSAYACPVRVISYFGCLSYRQMMKRGKFYFSCLFTRDIVCRLI